jgi:hypothetical protein
MLSSSREEGLFFDVFFSFGSEELGFRNRSNLTPVADADAREVAFIPERARRIYTVSLLAHRTVREMRRLEQRNDRALRGPRWGIAQGPPLTLLATLQESLFDGAATGMSFHVTQSGPSQGGRAKRRPRWALWTASISAAKGRDLPTSGPQPILAGVTAWRSPDE